MLDRVLGTSFRLLTFRVPVNSCQWCRASAEAELARGAQAVCFQMQADPGLHSSHLKQLLENAGRDRLILSRSTGIINYFGFYFREIDAAWMILGHVIM